MESVLIVNVGRVFNPPLPGVLTPVVKIRDVWRRSGDSCLRANIIPEDLDRGY